MSVLIDTPVWSEFFRRTAPAPGIREKVREIVTAGDALMIGPIRQELLSGVRIPEQWERLRTALRSFRDERLLTADYEAAAAFISRCRSAGIQGSNTDFLICAVSDRLQAPIFTLDRDFENYATVLQIQLLKLAP